MEDIILSPIKLSDLEILIQNSVERAFKASQSKNETPQEDLMAVKEAASFLDITVSTLYIKTSRNEIPFMKKGKKLYFSRAELRYFLRGGHHKTTEAIKATPEDYLQEPRKTKRA